MGNTLLAKLRGRLDLLVIMVIIVTLFGFVLTLLKTPRYETNAKVLIIQEHANTDAFTAAKSVEFVASVLNEAIYANSFIDAALKNTPSLTDQFSSDPTKRSREWADAVNSQVQTSTGIITLSVLHSDAQISQELTKTIVTTMITSGDLYHGGRNITIRLIDGPVTSDKPTDPNVFANTVMALIIGVIVGAAVVIVLPTKSSGQGTSGGHPENEHPTDLSGLRDGHTAHMASEHVVSEDLDSARVHPDAVPKMIKPGETMDFSSMTHPSEAQPQVEEVERTPTPEALQEAAAMPTEIPVVHTEETPQEALAEAFAEEVPATPVHDQPLPPQEQSQRDEIQAKIQRWVKTGKF